MTTQTIPREGQETSRTATAPNGAASDGATPPPCTSATPAQTAPLPLIRGDGLQSASDGGVMRPDGTLHLLSLLGPATPARYLSAHLAAGKRLEVQAAPPRGPWTALWGMAEGGYRTVRRSLAVRLTHTLVIGRACDLTRQETGLRAFALILRRDRPDQTAAALYTAALMALLDEPLDASWAPWLWRRARATGEARPLVVWGPVISAAWECDLPRSLRAEISAAWTGTSPYGDLALPAGVPAAERRDAASPRGAVRCQPPCGSSL